MLRVWGRNERPVGRYRHVEKLGIRLLPTIRGSTVIDANKPYSASPMPGDDSEHMPVELLSANVRDITDQGIGVFGSDPLAS